MAHPRIPLACYRLQFNRDFTFSRATDTLSYLSRLGITDIYASPLLQSRSGSQHGYDVTDPSRIDGELGDEEQFEAFQSALQNERMGLLLDIVPNHMAASPENPWWMDVLENGPGILLRILFRYRLASAVSHARQQNPTAGARQFLWRDPQQPASSNSSFDAERFFDPILRHVFSLGSEVLPPDSEASRTRTGKEPGFGIDSAFQEYLGIVAALAALPERESLTIDAAGQRRLEVQGIKERLRQLHETNREVQQFVRDNLRIFNGRRNDAGSFRDLDRLLSEQAYVLAYWQNVNEAINYRRFFTITDLVGMRVEDSVVFEATIMWSCTLIERKVVTGLRIDHIDGLRDPLGYLRRLQERAGGSHEKENRKLLRDCGKNTFAEMNSFPGNGRFAGTTGYEYLNALNRLFVHPEGARADRTDLFSISGTTS